MKEAKTKSKNELLPGTLEMLILKTLSIESMHGYGIAQHLQMLSADVRQRGGHAIGASRGRARAPASAKAPARPRRSAPREGGRVGESEGRSPSDKDVVS